MLKKLLYRARRLPVRSAPSLARHRASKQGGFTWRGRFVPLAGFSVETHLERLHEMAPVNWSWPL
jgi:hypothetical protein